MTKPGDKKKDESVKQSQPVMVMPVSLAKQIADYIQQVPSGEFVSQVPIQLVARIQVCMSRYGYLLNGPGEAVTKIQDHPDVQKQSEGEQETIN